MENEKEPYPDYATLSLIEYGQISVTKEGPLPGEYTYSFGQEDEKLMDTSIISVGREDLEFLVPFSDLPIPEQHGGHEIITFLEDGDKIIEVFPELSPLLIRLIATNLPRFENPFEQAEYLWAIMPQLNASSDDIKLKFSVFEDDEDEIGNEEPTNQKIEPPLIYIDKDGLHLNNRLSVNWSEEPGWHTSELGAYKIDSSDDWLIFHFNFFYLEVIDVDVDQEKKYNLIASIYIKNKNFSEILDQIKGYLQTGTANDEELRKLIDYKISAVEE